MKRILFLCLIVFHQAFSQEVSSETQNEVVDEIEYLHQGFKPLEFSPTKAGWRSAILPGWGQYYNRKYWKIPIVWVGVGTGIGFIAWNQKQYKRYRNAFEAELRGEKHEFSDIKGIDLKTALGNKQDDRRRQRDYAIAITLGVYLLNIVDAVVDAHLYEGRKDSDLAISPIIFSGFSAPEYSYKLGVSLNYTF